MRNTEGNPPVSEFGRFKKKKKKKGGRERERRHRVTPQPPKSLTYISLLSLGPLLKLKINREQPGFTSRVPFQAATYRRLRPADGALVPLSMVQKADGLHPGCW